MEKFDPEKTLPAPPEIPDLPAEQTEARRDFDLAELKSSLLNSSEIKTGTDFSRLADSLARSFNITPSELSRFRIGLRNTLDDLITSGQVSDEKSVVGSVGTPTHIFRIRPELNELPKEPSAETHESTQVIADETAAPSVETETKITEPASPQVEKTDEPTSTTETTPIPTKTEASPQAPIENEKTEPKPPDNLPVPQDFETEKRREQARKDYESGRIDTPVFIRRAEDALNIPAYIRKKSPGELADFNRRLEQDLGTEIPVVNSVETLTTDNQVESREPSPANLPAAAGIGEPPYDRYSETNSPEVIPDKTGAITPSLERNYDHVSEKNVEASTKEQATTPETTEEITPRRYIELSKSLADGNFSDEFYKTQIETLNKLRKDLAFSILKKEIGDNFGENAAAKLESLPPSDRSKLLDANVAGETAKDRLDLEIQIALAKNQADIYEAGMLLALERTKGGVVRDNEESKLLSVQQELVNHLVSQRELFGASINLGKIPEKIAANEERTRKATEELTRVSEKTETIAPKPREEASGAKPETRAEAVADLKNLPKEYRGKAERLLKSRPILIGTLIRDYLNPPQVSTGETPEEKFITELRIRGLNEESAKVFMNYALKNFEDRKATKNIDVERQRLDMERLLEEQSRQLELDVKEREARREARETAAATEKPPATPKNPVRQTTETVSTETPRLSKSSEKFISKLLGPLKNAHPIEKISNRFNAYFGKRSADHERNRLADFGSDLEQANKTEQAAKDAESRIREELDVAERTMKETLGRGLSPHERASIEAEIKRHIDAATEARKEGRETQVKINNAKKAIANFEAKSNVYRERINGRLDEKINGNLKAVARYNNEVLTPLESKIAENENRIKELESKMRTLKDAKDNAQTPQIKSALEAEIGLLHGQKTVLEDRNNGWLSEVRKTENKVKGLVSKNKKWEGKKVEILGSRSESDKKPPLDDKLESVDRTAPKPPPESEEARVEAALGIESQPPPTIIHEHNNNKVASGQNNNKNTDMNFEQPSVTENIEEDKVKKSHEGMQQQVKAFEGRSGYKREMMPDGREKITSPEGEEFYVKALTPENLKSKERNEDPAIKAIREMMVKEFGRGEAETLAWIRTSIKKGLNDYHAVESADGKLIGFTSSQYLEMEPLPGKENDPKESFVFLCYVVTAEEARGKGIGTELYRKFYEDAMNKANARGHEIKGVIDEAVSSVEIFTNKMGRDRVYYEDKDGNIREVPYMCPPVDMDSKTGKPPEGEEGQAYPEHLMLGLTNGAKETSVEDVLRMVKRIYMEYIAGEENYDSNEAFQTAWNHDMQILEELKQNLAEAKDGKVFLMSAEEREAKKQELATRGKSLVEVETGE